MHTVSSGAPGASIASVVLVLTLALGALAAVLVSGTSPQLGLDLQGGASVVLQPTTKVPASVLDEAIEIIRNRVDALGVSEPDISRQGSSIIVQLPGVRNRDRALEVVGQTAELLFRPVREALPATPAPQPAPDTVGPAAEATSSCRNGTARGGSSPTTGSGRRR